MIIDDSTFFIKQAGMDIKTTLAEDWVLLSNGKWTSRRLNVKKDRYESYFTIYGTRDQLDMLVLLLQEKRDLGTPTIDIQFETNEYPFGVNIDYSSSLSCTVFNDLVIQHSAEGFNCDLKLRLLNPTFTGPTIFPATLKGTEYGYTADTTYTQKPYFYYDNTSTPVNSDPVTDNGVFSGTMIGTISELQAIRNHLRTNSNATFTVDGILFPFGRYNSKRWPVKMNKIAVTDEQRLGPTQWRWTMSGQEAS